MLKWTQVDIHAGMLQVVFQLSYHSTHELFSTIYIYILLINWLAVVVLVGWNSMVTWLVGLPGHGFSSSCPHHRWRRAYDAHHTCPPPLPWVPLPPLCKGPPSHLLVEYMRAEHGGHVGSSQGSWHWGILPLEPTWHIARLHFPYIIS